MAEPSPTRRSPIPHRDVRTDIITETGKVADVFRRRESVATKASSASKEDATDKAQSSAAADGGRSHTEGKGRPTPKRREAQRQRPRLQAPRGRKEAYRQVKERQRGERQRARAALAAGDERYLPARDRGPVRKLARDYVDSRRGVGEFFLILSLAIIALTLVPYAPVQIAVYNIAFPLLLIVIVVESVRSTRAVKRLAAERHPNESTRGIGFYTATRGLQIRRLRMPPPKVKPGQRT